MFGMIQTQNSALVGLHRKAIDLEIYCMQCIVAGQNIADEYKDLLAKTREEIDSNQNQQNL